MISLIHPSRGRPDKSYATVKEWRKRADCETELIVSIDFSDPLRRDYEKYYGIHCLFKNNNESLVEATNVAAKLSSGDILVYLSDDFKCFDGWGKVIENEFTKYQGPTLLKVDDCLQKFDVPVLTIPIMNRACYDKLGYFFHTGYKSMFVDEHLYWRTKKLGFLKLAPHLKFEHCHVSVGKAENDDTYKRSAANWDQGKTLFAQHRRIGFTV